MDRHFTVSVYVVNNNRVLLHKHKKAQILLPVGGHIEINELREIKDYLLKDVYYMAKEAVGVYKPQYCLTQPR